MLPAIVIPICEEELFESLPERCGEEGIEDRIDTGVGIGQHMTANLNKTLVNARILLLPHSAPSWIFSLSENLASSNLQDGASERLYYAENPIHPPTQPPTA